MIYSAMYSDTACASSLTITLLDKKQLVYQTQREQEKQQYMIAAT